MSAADLPAPAARPACAVVGPRVPARRVSVHDRVARPEDAPFQGFELAAARLVSLDVGGAPRLGHADERACVAETEEGQHAGPPVRQYGVEDFQLGQTLAAVSAQPAVTRERRGREVVELGPVALAQEGDEERPAVVYLLEADVDDAPVFDLLARHAPAEIDVDEVDAVRLQALAQRGEDHADEVVALRVHVAEGGGEEDLDCAPSTTHPALRTPSVVSEGARRGVALAGAAWRARPTIGRRAPSPDA